MISFVPNYKLKETKPCEFVFVVDCSGSMAGVKMENAKKALQLYLKSIPQGSIFNVVTFGSSYHSLFKHSSEYKSRKS